MKSVGFFRMAQLSYLKNIKGMGKEEKLSVELEKTQKLLMKKLYKIDRKSTRLNSSHL